MGQTSAKPGVVVDDKYRLIEPLGEGGIGTVWRAWQELVDRGVAIKLLKRRLTDEFRDRFLVEARALGRLNHPNCITIHDFGYSEELEAYYLVMEELQGEPLDRWLGRRVPLSDIVEVGRQIANGLAYAHHQGVLHRDLKPENVFLVDAFNGETLVKLLDFGLARLVERQDERLTKSGEIFGTPVYMSPEQIQGKLNAGPSTDLYSLGVMLFELIDNRLPFWGETTFEIMTAHMNAPVPQLRRGVPSELAHIVYRLLEKKPVDRFDSALDVWNALGDVNPEMEDESHRFVVVDSPEATWSELPESFATAHGFNRQTETLQDETLQDETLQDETLQDETLQDETLQDDEATAETLADDTGTARTLEDERVGAQTATDAAATNEVQDLRPPDRENRASALHAVQPPEPTEDIRRPPAAPTDSRRTVALGVVGGLLLLAAVVGLITLAGETEPEPAVAGQPTPAELDSEAVPTTEPAAVASGSEPREPSEGAAKNPAVPPVAETDPPDSTDAQTEKAQAGDKGAARKRDAAKATKTRKRRRPRKPPARKVHEKPEPEKSEYVPTPVEAQLE